MKQLTSRKEARARRAARRGGQALIELAAAAVILILLTMGIIQFGMIYSTTTNLTNLAREGARYGAIHGTETNVADQVRAYVRANATGTGVRPSDLSDASISVDIPSRTPGQPLTVRITYDMTRKFFMPTGNVGFLSDEGGRWSRFSQQATMTIE